ncbi:heavy metal sensor histidine kinase [Chitiniphilus purpureus]|uniref:Sensor protein n=1 Tax=Chitiniphilus purpureus TaxID=2981137 RepID=A0ABY6DST0_9NEIS|nr:heavy metal sensor histidine kinase [Chitiniphilus sp. CD1]UXY14953.1 heavy metal sensor histidine kinase [Chitiniphilus sp. CD1]
MMGPPRSRRRSLALRVGGLVSLFSALLVLIAGVGMDRLLQLALERRAETELSGKMALVQSAIEQPRPGISLDAELALLLVGHPYLHWAIVDGTKVTGRSGPFAARAAARVLRQPLQPGVGELDPGNALSVLVWRSRLAGGQERWLLGFIERGGDGGLLAAFRKSLALMLPFVIVFIALGSWVVARRALRPLRRFNTLVGGITAQSLHSRLSAEDVPAELRDLAHSFNNMLERLEKSVSRLSQFSADLAHEMRTPLTNLMGEVQVCLGKPRDVATYQTVLASAEEEMQRLNRLITDLLFLASAEQPQQALRIEPIALRPLVEGLFDFFDALAEAKGITLALSGEGSVEADKGMLQRALTNLLSNAIRHGHPDSTVQVILACGEGGTAIMVSNRGHRIPEAHLPHLAERFYRVNPARSRDDGGTGLGLAIAASIMQLHGGMLTVASDDESTTFSLRFPGASQGAAALIPR